MIPASHWHDNGDGSAWWVIDTHGDHRLQRGWLDRPCDTCDGEGNIWDDDDDGSYDCPDCDGTGRHAFTIEVSCLGDTERCRFVMTEHEHTLRVSVVPDMIEEQEDGTWRVMLQIH